MKHFRPLRTCTAAPSPAVLSFLRSQVRNAFELQSPTAARRCGALLRERGSRDVATCARARMGMTLEVNGGNGRVCSLESACTPVQRIAAPSTLKKLQCPTFLANRNNQARSSSIQPLTTSIDGRRCFSSTPAQRWTVRQLWSKWRRKRARQPPLKLPTSPLAAVTEDGTNGLPAYGRSPRSAANELKMRCTELDEHGNVTMVSGEFKKSELIAKVCRLALLYTRSTAPIQC